MERGHVSRQDTSAQRTGSLPALTLQHADFLMASCRLAHLNGPEVCNVAHRHPLHLQHEQVRSKWSGMLGHKGGSARFAQAQAMAGAERLAHRRQAREARLWPRPASLSTTTLPCTVAMQRNEMQS